MGLYIISGRAARSLSNNVMLDKRYYLVSRKGVRVRTRNGVISTPSKIIAPVTQLVRVSVLYAESRKFKPFLVQLFRGYFEETKIHRMLP